MIINMTSGGVMPERIIDAQTITPGTKNQVIEEGTYLRGPLTILGDEDLNEENIKDGKNIFGVAGKYGVGANVWRKSVITQPEIAVNNPSAYFAYRAGSDTIEISSPNFDLTQITDWITFFDGFKAVGSNVERRFYNSYGALGLIFQDTAYAAVRSFTATSKATATMGMSKAATAELSYTYQYVGAKVMQPMAISPVGYITSDNPSEYPNGGLHTDGYYYELVETI